MIFMVYLSGSSFASVTCMIQIILRQSAKPVTNHGFNTRTSHQL
ncbi:hypothetical protein GPLA_4151 [Paraglaciecola polaris LMG 21857]|uniref:Uncharacterized protein n=1 Tax=Paraglaciecola polaris LMG 21857 TaxID=1129793 RepID=K7AIE9_9ALTE|nr:hypothetical protein GPLA_4151 [Paraglaciecola polaris LMG 21857]